MKANEGIRIQPMTSRSSPSVDQRHLDIGLSHQRVGKGKAACTRPYDQIIGINEHPLAPHLRTAPANSDPRTITSYGRPKGMAFG